MNRTQGRIRILGLILRRNHIEKINVIASLNELKLKLSKLERSIDVNMREYQGLLHVMTRTMRNSQVIDPLLWQERIRYAQDIQSSNTALSDSAGDLRVEIAALEKELEVFASKERSLERKVSLLNKELCLEKAKTEELVLSDIYAVHVTRSI